MTQKDYTTKVRTFQHLTREKRAQIEMLLREGLSKVEIAKAVGISRSTLYNESSSVLLSIDEKLTRKRHLVKIPSRSSEAVRLGLKKIAGLYGESLETVFKSVTSDNGSEFVDLGRYLPKSTKVYYAHPYSSYERGTSEKQNSLVRRFFPKGKSFDNITDEQIAFVEHWINNLPRKIFNYHCSDFIFYNVLFDIAF